MKTGLRRPFVLSAAVTLLLSFVSCDKSPTKPSTGPESGQFVSLRIVAPPDIAPAESVQLTANAVKADGSVQDVTNQTEWTAVSVPAGSRVLTVTRTGVATGLDRGQVALTARFGGLTADATIFILPKGTFRLTGRITAAGTGLENVTVTVISGIGEGLTARTNASGNYDLYGVAGVVQIRASKEGYLDRAQLIEVTGHSSLSFELARGRAGDYAGLYTVIFTAGSCTAGYPDQAKRRVYTARVDQTGGDMRVSLSGADFWPGSSAFNGVVTGEGEFRFTIRPEYVWDYDAFDVMERITSGLSIIISGVIVAASTPAGIVGGADQNGYGNAGEIRVNSSTLLRCNIDRFEMVPQ